jgi:integrase
MNALISAHAEVFIQSLPLRERLIWRIGSQTGLRLTDILNLYKKDVLNGKWATRERKTGKRKRCRVDKATIMLARAYMETYKTPHKKSFL